MAIRRLRARGFGTRGIARMASGAVRVMEKWQYAGDKRDLRLDLLRGLAAVTMIIDHVGGKDSWLYAISGGDRFFVSAAEGFVAISGLVMGIVYAGVIARQGLRAALAKAAKRAGTLYALTVGLSLAFAAVSFMLGLRWAPDVNGANFLDFVVGIFTLRRAFYLTDVLLFYTLAIAASILVLALMSRGYTWLVLTASGALWTAWQWWPDTVQIPWAVTDGTTFNFSAWQVLFVGGLAIGFHRKSLEGRITRLARGRAGLKLTMGLGALILSGAVVAASVAFYLWYQSHPGDLITVSQLGGLIGKTDMRAGRLALFSALFTFAFLLTTLFWTPIKRLLGWLLLPLGQDALTAYSLHLFVIALVADAVPALMGAEPQSAAANALVQALAIALIWAALRAKVRLRKAVAGGRWSVVGDRRQLLTAGRVQRLGASRAARTGLAVLAVVGVVCVSAGPALARAFTGGAVTTVYDSSDMSSASVTAEALPTEAASSFAMLVSGTAVPTGPVPTPTKTVLTSYEQQSTFASASLNRVMPYYIYLPPSYGSDPTRRYPVLYMLHGISGTYNEWLNYGLFGKAHDMMVTGQIPEFLIVLPQGDQGYWVDQANGGPKWGTYVARDVVGQIDANFRTIADRNHRAVGGLSMGGSGALQLAINFPDVFGTAGGHSPSLHTYNSAPSFFGDQAYFDAHDPVYLYKAHPDIAQTLKLWVDDGQGDDWLPEITAFHTELQAGGVAHEWHVYGGAHDGEYWSTHVLDYLRFYASVLTGGSGSSTAGSGVRSESLPPISGP